MSLRQFIKAAKIDWKATSLDVQDKRDAVILDTALTYAQLEQLAGKIKALDEAQTAAEKAESVSQQRLQQGVDSQLEVTRSQLVTARIRLRIAEAEGPSRRAARASVQAAGLAGRTQIAVEPESVPQIAGDLSGRRPGRSARLRTACW